MYIYNSEHAARSNDKQDEAGLVKCYNDDCSAAHSISSLWSSRQMP